MYSTELARANLRLVLLEAVLWASTWADAREPVRSLRSASLAPYIFNESRHETVHDVALRRHLQLEAQGRVRRIGGRTDDLVDASSIALGHVRAMLEAGRLLVWERDSTVDDGVGQTVTSGYLDESDMPPWDTWVAYVDSEVGRCGYLVSWVPEPFVAPVAQAIKENAYAALYWLRESKLLLAQILRSEDLLT